MRLIDADALKQHYAWWGDTESGKKDKELFDTIVDLQPTVGEWISVEERLPEEMNKNRTAWSRVVRPTNDVLVYLKEKDRIIVAWYSYTFNTWITTDEVYDFDNDEISHWMQLPTPPEVE